MTQSNQTTSNFGVSQGLQMIPNALLIFNFTLFQSDPGSVTGFILYVVGMGLSFVGIFALRNCYQGVDRQPAKLLQPSLPTNKLQIIVALGVILLLCIGIAGMGVIIGKIGLYRFMGLFIGFVCLVIGWGASRQLYWLLGLVLLVVSADVFNWLVSDRFIEYGGNFFIWGVGQVTGGVVEHVQLVRSGQWLVPGKDWKYKVGFWLLLAFIMVYMAMAGGQFLRFAVFAPHVIQVGQLGLGNNAEESGLSIWHDMAVNGRFLHLVVESGTLYTIDATTPAAPALLSTFTLPTDGSLIEVADGIVYIHDRREQLSIVDVSDPAAPVLFSQASYPANTLVIADSLLYLVGNTTISILNVRDPRQPTLLTQIQVGVVIRHFAINGRFAYAATRAELILIDLSIPTAPQEVERYTVQTQYASIDTMTVLGDMIYLVVSGDQLYILQQVDGALSLLNEFQLPYAMQDATVQGNLFYGLNYDKLHLVDISNPQRPYRVGWYELSWRVEQLAVWENQIFITHEDEGLLVYQLKP